MSNLLTFHNPNSVFPKSKPPKPKAKKKPVQSAKQKALTRIVDKTTTRQAQARVTEHDRLAKKGVKIVGYAPSKGYKGGSSGDGPFSRIRSQNRPSPVKLPGAKALHPVGVVTKKIVENAPDVVLGPSVVAGLEGKPVTAEGLGLDALGLLPIGKGLRAMRLGGEITKAVAAGHRGHAAIEAARASASKLPADRIIDAGGVIVRTPAAPERHIRAAQKVLDKTLESHVARGVKAGLRPQEALAAKGTVRGKIARAHSKHITEFTGFYERKGAEAAPKALANVKHSDSQWIALRQMSRNVHPGITVKANEKRIAEARAAGDNKAVADLRRENKLLHESRHYIEGSGSDIHLRQADDKSSKKLLQTWKDMQREGLSAEHIQIKNGQLTHEGAIVRRNSPGELDLANASGKEWYPPNKTNLKPTRGLVRQRQLVESMQRRTDAMRARVEKAGLSSADKKAIEREATVKPVEDSRLIEPTIGSHTVGGAQSNSRLLRNQGSAALDRQSAALSVQKDRLQSMEAAYVKRQAKYPKTGIQHSGGLYYTSKRTGQKQSVGGFSSGARGRLPFTKRPETKQPFGGVVQRSGQEDFHVGNIIGKSKLSRVSREMANDKLAELRSVALTGTLPKGDINDLDKMYRVIAMTSHPGGAAESKWSNLVHNLEMKTSVTPKELEEAGQSLREWRDEVLPTVKQIVKDGRLPKEYGLVSRAVLGALEDPKLFNTHSIGELHRAMMTMSSVAKDMIVYTKIGHMPPRLVSNILMALPDTGLDFIRGMKALPTLRKLRPDLADWLHELGGGGYYKALTETSNPAHKAAQKLNEHLVGWIERTADRPARDAAALAFAIKDSGVKDVPSLIKYLDSLREAKPGTEAWHSRTRITMGFRQAAGEYERVGKDAALGNWLFLYRWHKTAGLWTARFIAKHPIQAAALGAATYYGGYKGGNQIWNRFNIYGHNVTTATPWSTPVEDIERGIRVTGVGGFPPLGESIFAEMHPGLKALVQGAGHIDLERGAKISGNSWEKAFLDFVHQTPPGALIGGKGDFWSYRLPKYVFGNYAPNSPPPASSSATYRGSKSNQKKLVHQFFGR